MQTLKEVRKQRGVLQKAVAEHLGISRQTYGKYENNQECMTIGQAKAVCEFLHCDIDDVFLPVEGN